MKRYTARFRRETCDLYVSGFTQHQTALAMGVCIETVRCWLRALGVPKPPSPLQSRNARIMRAFALGYDGPTIGRMCGLGKNRVYQIRDEMRARERNLQ